MAAAEEHDDGKNKHGFPQGYTFVPKKLELIGILSDRLADRPLPHPLPRIFHEIRILDFHPAQLYDTYKKSAEAGFIYFFSRRQFQTLVGKKKRPVRVAAGGAWKASGGGKAVKTMRDGGVDVGQMLTMVFYQRRFQGDRDPDKTTWALHEFTAIIGPDKLADMAVYRLYRMKKGGKKKKADRLNGSDKCVATFTGADKPSTSTVLALPSPGQKASFMANQANVASTSQTHMVQGVIERAQYSHHYAFGAASAPGPSSWAPPTAAHQPAQHAPLHGAGHAGYVGFTNSPAPSMASLALPVANYPPPHGAGQFGYAGHADCWQQPLGMDPPPPAPAPAAEVYMADAFNEWCEMQQQASTSAAAGGLAVAAERNAASPSAAAALAVADGRYEWCDIQQQAASPSAAAGLAVADGCYEWCDIQQQAASPSAAAGLAVADGRYEWCDIQQQASPSTGLAVPEDEFQLLLGDDLEMLMADDFDDKFTMHELCGGPMDGAATESAMTIEGGEGMISNPADGGDNGSGSG